MAQAAFRRGQCLLKLGKREEAEQAFQQLVAQFADSPEQQELVAAAKKLLPARAELALRPAAWEDGEQLELRVKMGAGLEIGGNPAVSCRAEFVLGDKPRAEYLKRTGIVY